jgi:hypothetical protein
LEDHIARLLETDTWPVVHRQGGDEIEPGTEMKYYEMAKAVADLMRTITTMNDLLNEYVRARNAIAEVDVAMEVDEYGGMDGTRPIKRRRTMEGAEELNDERSANTSVIIQQEIAALRETLITLEGRLSDFENDRTQQNGVLMEHIESRIESSLEDFDIGKPSAKDSAALQITSDRLNEMDQDVNATGAQVDVIAVEIGNLITQSTSTETDIARLRQELQELTVENAAVSFDVLLIATIPDQCCHYIDHGGPEHIPRDAGEEQERDRSSFCCIICPHRQTRDPTSITSNPPG